MPPAKLKARSCSSATPNFELGRQQYTNGLWHEAARSFDRAITLQKDHAESYEGKARAQRKIFRQENAQFKDTGEGPDGLAAYNAAYATAKKTIERFGKKRWQPYYITAEILYENRLYAKAQLYLAQIEPHLAYQKANSAQKAAVQEFAEKVAHDRRFLPIREAGRAESAAIEKDLEREAQIRRRTNYEHVLSPDIFLRIVEVAKESDPRLPVRMSGVCRRWRATLVNQRGVWQRLILGKGRDVLLKVRTYLERCAGQDGGEASGLKELRITEGFDWNKAGEVGRLLKPHAKYIERLRVDTRSAETTSLLRHFHQSMRSLRVLEVRRVFAEGAHQRTSTSSLDFDLPMVGSSFLQELMLSHITYTPASLQNFPSSLENISIIRLIDCTFPIGAIPYMIRRIPRVKEVSLLRVRESLHGGGIDDGRAETAEEKNVLLENLERWCAEDNLTVAPDILPDLVTAPNLLHLDCNVIHPSLCPTLAVRSPSLQGSLAKLRSLSMAKTALPNGFIEVLAEMSCLEFLDVSRASLSAKFLDDLAAGANAAPPLLPRLVALSLAGNLELRAPVLRDLVNSRLPEQDRIPVPALPSAYRPRGPFALKRSKPAAPATGSSLPSQSHLLTPPPSLATPPPEIARLRWLNIDHCDNVDSALYASLERKLGFFSRSMGVPDEDRIRGRGRWDWELDLSVGCRWKLKGDGVQGSDKDKCEVRPNGKGGYAVYHVCAQAEAAEEEEKGWEWTSQIQRSQLAASQAKKGKGTAGGRGRRGRIEGMQEE